MGPVKPCLHRAHSLVSKAHIKGMSLQINRQVYITTKYSKKKKNATGPPSVCRSPWLLSQWWQNQDSNHILAPPTASPALSKWGWRADPSPLWTYLRPLWSQVFTSAFPGLSSLPQCMGLRSVRHGMLAMGSFQVC